MKLRRMLLLASVAATCSLLPASAAPSGPFNYAFDGATSPVWDLSGTYELSPTVDNDISVEFTITVTEDTNGKITGAGSTPVRIDGISSQGNYKVTGKVFRSGSVTKVSPNVKVTGSGILGGKQRTYGLQATYALTLDTASRTLTGNGRGSAQASGVGEGPVKDTISAGLPPDLNPGWDLQLQIATSGKKITGTATVILNNGRQVNFNAKGTYVAKTGMSTITLTDVSKSTNLLKLTTFGDTMELRKITGMLFGQQVK